jgi:hypothetical protein
MPPTLYRCVSDGSLVREKDFENHAGHRLSIANKCSIWEYFVYHYWRLTNQL